MTPPRVARTRSNVATDSLRQYHAEQASKAKEEYLRSQTPSSDAQGWLAAIHRARRDIGDALIASSHLRDVGKALQGNGAYMHVFRHLMAPPLSQDQFRLICPEWSKASEKKGAPLEEEAANAVAAAFDERRVLSLTPWLAERRAPTVPEVRRLQLAIAPLIANQRFATERRVAASALQEQSVISSLKALGWSIRPSSLIDTRAALAPKEFMHKTRFATSPDASQAQEVDIACGLAGTYVLAMECKVTNDETNSVKRVNDVIKKAVAWKDHWGSFVETAALLQGVIKPSDVYRLLDADVHVFWSHDLSTFESWINARV